MKRDEESRRGRGRPRSKSRTALADAAHWWYRQRVDAPLVSVEGKPLIGATWAELREKASLARGHGAQVLKNMVRAGELRRIGRALPDGAERALGVYAPTKLPEPRWLFAPAAQAVDAMARSHT